MFESLRITEAFSLPPVLQNFHITTENEAFDMDHWISAHIQQRREELYAEAARARVIRMLESGRSSGIRGRIANLLAFFVA